MTEIHGIYIYTMIIVIIIINNNTTTNNNIWIYITYYIISYYSKYTLWLFNIAMENDPFID